MIVFLCPSCGRLGMLEPPETDEEVACLYCGSNDLDYLSRPGMSEGGDELLPQLERKVLEVLHLVYENYDFAGVEPEEREARLRALREYLENVPCKD